MPKKKPAATVASAADIHRDRQRLPDALVDKFGQFGFVKWTSSFCPVLIVDPIELIQQKVLPEGIYHAWMYKIDLSLEDDDNQVPALIYWYGTTYEFSVVALRDVMPYEQGKALGYDTVPDFMARRMDLEMSVPAVYQLVREGMEQLTNSAAKLPPSKRSSVVVHPKRKRQVVLNEWHALSMDPPPHKQLWLQKRDRLLGKLPNAQHFGTIGFLPFTKGGSKQQHQHYHPILILSPFRVPPGPIRQEWFHKCSSKQMVLVYWFGAYICGRPQSAYSFSFLSQVVSLEAGIQLGYDQLPPYALQEYYGSSNTRPNRTTNDASKRTVAQRLSWMADWLVCGHWELQQALTKNKEDRWGGLEDFEEDFADDFEYYWECIEAAEIAIQAKQQFQNEKKQIYNKTPGRKSDTPESTTNASANQQDATSITEKGANSAKKKPVAGVNEEKSDGVLHQSLKSMAPRKMDKKIRSRRRDDGNSPESAPGRLPLELSGSIGESSVAASEIHSDGSNGRSRASKKLMARSKTRRLSTDVEDGGEAGKGYMEGAEDSFVETPGSKTKQHDGNDHSKDDKVDIAISKFARLKGKKLKRRRRSQSASDESNSETINIPDRTANGGGNPPDVLHQSIPKKLKKRRRTVELDDDDMILGAVEKADNSSTQYVYNNEEKGDAKNVVASFRIPRKRDKRSRAVDKVEENRAQEVQAVTNNIQTEEATTSTSGIDQSTGKSSYEKEARDWKTMHASGKAEGKRSKGKSSKSVSERFRGESPTVRNIPELNGTAGTPDGTGKEKLVDSVHATALTKAEANDSGADNDTKHSNDGVGDGVETGARLNKSAPVSATSVPKKLKKDKRSEKFRKKSGAKRKKDMNSTHNDPKTKNAKHSLQAETKKPTDGKPQALTDRRAHGDHKPTHIESKKARGKQSGNSAEVLKSKHLKLSYRNDVPDSIVEDVVRSNNHTAGVDGKRASAASGAEGAAGSQRNTDRGTASESRATQDISIIQILNNPLTDSTSRSSTSPLVIPSRVGTANQEPDTSVNVVSRRVPRDNPPNIADVSLVQHMSDAKFSLVNERGAVKAGLDEGKDSREVDTSLDEAVQNSLLSCAAALKGDGVQSSAPIQTKKNKRKNGKEADAQSVAVATPMSPDRLAELKRHEETQEVVARVIEEWTKNKERMMRLK